MHSGDLERSGAYHEVSLVQQRDGTYKSPTQQGDNSNSTNNSSCTRDEPLIAACAPKNGQTQVEFFSAQGEFSKQISMEAGNGDGASYSSEEGSDDLNRHKNGICLIHAKLCPNNFRELFALLPGIVMIIMFGYTYVAVITVENPSLAKHSGFLLVWCQISNIAVTLSAGVFGSTKWAIGGPNTTTAILLRAILQDSDIETALIIQGIASLITAAFFLITAWIGGFGRLFGDRNPSTALYADYIHPSLLMASAHATIVLMVKYSWEIALGGNVMTLDSAWWSELFGPKALSVWLPAWAVGGASVFIDFRLGRQMTAMCFLFGVPIAIFAGMVVTHGFDNMPSHHYWVGESSAFDSFSSIDFSNADWKLILRRLPLSCIGAFIIFIEAQIVYKEYSMYVSELRSIKHENISAGIANALIGCCGGLFGHQSFVESVVVHRNGFRFSYLGGLVGVAAFGGFAAIILSLETAPPFPTILLSAILFYLASVFFEIWFVQRMYPRATFFEWILSTAVLACCLIFGFNQGLAIGVVFVFIFVYHTKHYNYIVEKVAKDRENRTMRVELHGHMAHGNVPEIFDQVLTTRPKLKSLIIDIRKITSADSSLVMFIQSLALMSNIESIEIVVSHCLHEASVAYAALEQARELSGKFRDTKTDRERSSSFGCRPEYNRRNSLVVYCNEGDD